MPDYDLTLGLVPRLLSYLLLLVIVVAAAASVYRPPRHKILLWPYAFFLAYLACVAPLKVLLSGSHVYQQEVLEASVVAMSIAVAVTFIRRPTRPLYLAVSFLLALSVVKYALAFMRACNYCAVVDVLPLLKHPFWIDTLVGQLAASLAAATLAWLALWRADVFEKPEHDTT